MHANKFVSHKNNNHKITAYNKVKFFKTDLQGKCDSLNYYTKDSKIKMFKNLFYGQMNFKLHLIA